MVIYFVGDCEDWKFDEYVVFVGCVMVVDVGFCCLVEYEIFVVVCECDMYFGVVVVDVSYCWFFWGELVGVGYGLWGWLVIGC